MMIVMNMHVCRWLGVAFVLATIGCQKKSPVLASPGDSTEDDKSSVMAGESTGVGSALAMRSRTADDVPLVIFDAIGELVPSNKDVPEWIPKVPIPPVPVKIDLSTDLPEIGRQSLNDCVAWASAYYLRSYLWAKRSKLPANSAARQFSPTFVYNLINGGRDLGAHIPRALDLLRDRGVPSLWVAPAHEDYTRPPDYEQFLEAKNHKVTEYGRVQSRKGIVTALSLGLPVLVHVITDEEFNSGKHPVFTTKIRATSPDARAHGRHAMLVVGCEANAGDPASSCGAGDDTGVCNYKFKLVNSWGHGWGKAGFTWIDCAMFSEIGLDSGQTFVQEAYVISEWNDLEGRAESVVVEPPPIKVNLGDIDLSQVDRMGQAATTAETRPWQLSLPHDNPMLSLRSHELDDLACVRYPQQYKCDLTSDMAGRQVTVNIVDCTRQCQAVATEVVTIELGEFKRPTGLRLDNQALLLKGKVTPEGYQNFNWTVFVAASEEELRQIKSVTYKLDKSFPRPVVVVTESPSAGFPLSVVGYGEFVITATVAFKDATQKPRELEHCLQLGYDTPVCEGKRGGK